MTAVARLCIDCTDLAELTRPAGRAYRCTRHRLEFEHARNNDRPWLRGDWPRIAAAHINLHPTCAACGHRRADGALLEADHIDPRRLSAGLQSLCGNQCPCHRNCHQTKTTQELHR